MRKKKKNKLSFELENLRGQSYTNERTFHQRQLPFPSKGCVDNIPFHLIAIFGAFILCTLYFDALHLKPINTNSLQWSTEKQSRVSIIGFIAWGNTLYSYGNTEINCCCCSCCWVDKLCNTNILAQASGVTERSQCMSMYTSRYFPVFFRRNIESRKIYAQNVMHLADSEAIWMFISTVVLPQAAHRYAQCTISRLVSWWWLRNDFQPLKKMYQNTRKLP